MAWGRGRKGFENIFILFVCISLPGRDNEQQLTGKATDLSVEQLLQQEFQERAVSGQNLASTTGSSRHVSLAIAKEGCPIKHGVKRVQEPLPVTTVPLFVVLVD